MKVTIEDTGPGIKQEHLTKIFEPNIPAKKTDVKFGLGIGLSISIDIIDEHGGSIAVKNVDNQGALFTVTLPLRQ
ncbi:MAG: hypothetical protein GVY08_01730 [Bacteroidetes bacterium]|nr:hypothetical protein [Bacteroidota bacterium]